MQEPDWNEIPSGREPGAGDLVWVVKKSRGRFGSMQKAEKGEHGLVIAAWISSMGTPKLTFITRDNEMRAITASCVRVWAKKGVPADKELLDEWSVIHRVWMDKTYVPIIVTRKLKDKRYRRPEAPFVVSRDGNSVLVAPITAPARQLWLSQNKVHPDDWQSLSSGDQSCVSVRVPEWLARKGGAYG